MIPSRLDWLTDVLSSGWQDARNSIWPKTERGHLARHETFYPIKEILQTRNSIALIYRQADSKQSLIYATTTAKTGISL